MAKNYNYWHDNWTCSPHGEILIDNKNINSFSEIKIKSI